MESGTERTTECDETMEPNIKKIFVLREISTPEETHSGQFVPMDSMEEAQFEETKEQNQNELFNTIKILTEYNSPQILYPSKLTITVAQLLFSLIFIVAASHLYDASMATVALLSLIERATSHSNT